MKLFNVNDNNINNFNKMVMKEGQKTIVKYYADWCGHCKELNRKWPKIVNNVRKSKGNGILASVPEHMIHKLHCSKSIEGYPTIRYMVSGEKKGLDYNGIREVKELTRYIKKKLTRCKKTRRFKKTKKGYSSYLYLTSDNKQILVTEVSGTKEYTSSWDDAVYMGSVTKHIKSLP